MQQTSADNFESVIIIIPLFNVDIKNLKKS